ncbi:hypothetical protein P168DRAFT_330885, partial [Aspergillus campestris IBT 28561]
RARPQAQPGPWPRPPRRPLTARGQLWTLSWPPRACPSHRRQLAGHAPRKVRVTAGKPGRLPPQAPGAAGPATRTRTRPAWSLQSSAEDSSPREVTLQSASQLPGVSPRGPSPAC